MKSLIFIAFLSFVCYSNGFSQSQELKITINKQNNQLEVRQATDDKNVTSAYTLQRAEMDIFANGDAAGMLEIRNGWTVPVQEFEKGEIVQLEEVELVEKASGNIIKIKSNLQIFPE